MYQLTCDGHPILDKPLALHEIITTFGSIELLESKGFRLVKMN
jgi:hypothetical protein